jgi:hypothetical protein
MDIRRASRTASVRGSAVVSHKPDVHTFNVEMYFWNAWGEGTFSDRIQDSPETASRERIGVN